MVIQIEEMNSFLVQVAGSSSKGPSSMKCDRADRNIKIHATKAYSAEFTNRNARQEAREENNNPQFFVLGSGAWHRPSERKSIGDSFVRKQSSQERKDKSLQKYPNGLEKQVQETESVLAAEEDDKPLEISSPCG